MGELVRLEVEDGVGTIRLDRPPMNALDSEVQAQVRAAAEEAGDRADVAAVIVYGGETVFAAGADIKEMRSLSYTDMVDAAVALQDSFTAVARIPRPTVAAITGYALGGGCELALCCDFRVAGAGARLGQPEIGLGIIPGAGGTQRLARLIGPSRAKDMIFSGRFVDAQEALSFGLVDQVVPDEEVYRAAHRMVARYVNGPRYALRAAKEAIDSGSQVGLEAGLAIERAQFCGLFATEDQAIGMTSFVDRGPGKAEFRGR
jgi:enoyl-CoA hydratase/carnithine racemase